MWTRSGRGLCALALSLAVLASVTLANEAFLPVLELSGLDGTSGIVLSGIEGNSNEGSVSGAGDMNGDGISDVVFGIPFASPGGRNGAGATYVVFGSDTGLSASLDLSSLDGADGFVIHGISPGDTSGHCVSAAGDFNADGISDLVIGAPGANGSEGESYVVFGSDTGFPASLELSSLDGTNGFAIRGTGVSDQSGYSVSHAGDVNSDGISDVVIGALGANFLAGVSYVIFGSDAAFPASLDLSSLDGTNGFAIYGTDTGDLSGSSVSDVGDLNDDGISDIAIGAPGGNPGGRLDAGETYVVFGSDSGFGVSLELANLNGTNGLVINGVNADDLSGGSVSGADDLNGDGISDLVIGATNSDPGGRSNAGETYVVFGSDSGFPASLDLSSLNGSSGFVIHGIDADDASGGSVSSAGDVNGDGISDIVIGAEGAEAGGNALAGANYVVFGSDTGFPASLELSILDGSNGFTIDGIAASDRSGTSVSGAGDMNDDGISDLLIGAFGAFPLEEMYVVYGRRPCETGSVNAEFGIVLNVLFVNSSAGGSDRTVELTDGDFVDITILQPIAGGNGKFVLHANEGDLSDGAFTPMPFNIGNTCFPFLLTAGGSPAIVANNIGKTQLLGETNFYGISLDDPDPATTTITYAPLPLGTALTFQGLIIDPGSRSSKSASATNAVVVKILD